jgi:hypothetical protein
VKPDGDVFIDEGSKSGEGIPKVGTADLDPPAWETYYLERRHLSGNQISNR